MNLGRDGDEHKDTPHGREGNILHRNVDSGVNARSSQDLGLGYAIG